jgi:hypothetical protein
MHQFENASGNKRIEIVRMHNWPLPNPSDQPYGIQKDEDLEDHSA